MPGAVHGHGPLQPAEAPNLELVELISKFVSSGNDERETLRLQYPHLFDDPALSAALAEVSTQLATSLHEVRSTMSAVEGVATAVDLPTAASGGALHLQPGELHHLDSSEALLSHFSSALTDLLTRYVPEPLTNTTVVDRHHSPQRASHACGPTWATTPSIVFTVLSYLPAEAILTEAEEVCTAWQWWLGSPSESNFFWVAVVQREFPQRLAEFLAAEGSNALDCDWRTVAMLCITDAEVLSEDDGEEISP